MTAPIRVFVVEDNAVMREMLAEFIRAQSDMECVGAAPTAEDALGRLPGTGADVVLADLRLPGMNGAELARELSKDRPELSCLILSGHGEEGYVETALGKGARGYVLKGNPAELPEAIRRVHGGGRYLSPSLPRPRGNGS